MRIFAILAMEALRDAARRRIVAVVVLLSLLSLFGIDGCTSCAGEVKINGEARDMQQLAGVTGTLTFVVLALWSVVLAGVLAAEHLAQTLSDGSANLVLSRPVGRTSFALARLCGALAIAGGMAALLLGASAGLLHVRGGLALAPAALGACAVALGSITLGALSMTASLYLPRVAVMLLAAFSVAALTVANGVGLANPDVGGAVGAIDRLGPPIATALAVSLDPWITQIELSTDALEAWARLCAWAAGSLLVLGLAFRRIELGR
jgi:ABC-type transport system involved in multi-copper enzyme maturation permease subunit